MTALFAEEFSTRVLARFDTLQNPLVLKSRSIGEALQTGHPMYDRLAVGQRQSCEMASVFLDLTNFTGRTFWDEPGQVADLAHAVLSGFTGIVHRLGGHVLGLRGDGLSQVSDHTMIPGWQLPWQHSLLLHRLTRSRMGSTLHSNSAGCSLSKPGRAATTGTRSSCALALTR